MMIARIVWAIAALLAVWPVAADEFGGPDRPKGEWPDGPDKYYLHHLTRPDNHQHPDREDFVRSCCDAGDTVQTRFRVEAGDGPYPEDRWYAWLNGEWVAVLPDKIVPDYAPTGKAYLFVIDVPSDVEGRPDLQVVACFVRPKGGL
jgi:hypothetical protein